MRSIIAILFVSQIISSSLKAQQFKTEDDSLAYSLGVLVAGNLKNEGYGDLDMDVFAQGLRDAIKGEKTMLTMMQCQEVVQKQTGNRKKRMYESVRIAGEEFLAKNKLRPGVNSLPSGIQYEILQAGTGPKPKLSDKVLVHYHGTNIDGSIFDSSVDRGEPITFGLTQVISGWTETLQQMPQGSKWRVYIPQQLAYGEHGSGSKIKPFAPLIFEIELIKIQ